MKLFNFSFQIAKTKHLSGSSRILILKMKEKAMSKPYASLSDIERKTFELIKEVGEIQTKDLPNKQMLGAIATLKNKGLVEIYKRYTTIWQRKKKKFVKAKEN